jgi:hypothetical protein
LTPIWVEQNNITTKHITNKTMAKTAIYSCLEQLFDEIELSREEKGAADVSYRVGILKAFEIVKKHIPKEKEQIMNAYKHDLHPLFESDAEQYYKETYNEKM